MSNELEELKELSVRQHGEIRQMEEKIETLTHQKHTLEQTNIGLERELGRAQDEIERQRTTVGQMHDKLMAAETNQELAEAELKTMVDRLHRFMDKYI